MPEPLPDWPRPRFAPGGGEPFLFFAVFGASVDGLQVSRNRHRCEGVPAGIDIGVHDAERHAGVLDSFRSGFLWETLEREDAALARTIAAATRCVVLRGSPVDHATLAYLRDVVGLVEALLETGAVGVFDPQRFAWWSPAQWHDRVFEPGRPRVHEHVAILTSPMPDGTDWLHTRGMRQFGRPDLSMHRVDAALRGAAIAMFDRFIELQALGGVVAPGQPIRMAGLPGGLSCHHRGDEDDPDFNNRHIEIEWPAR